MTRRKRSGLLTVLLMIVSIQFATAQGALGLQIIPVFNGKPLILNDKMYGTENGDSVSIEVFKFYMSSISLRNESKRFAEKSSYHLVDAEDSSSLNFKIENIPEAEYSLLTFNIGVDSTASVSGAMGGALDPSLGMYWAWNTGYIDAKLVGHSPSCNTMHHQFDFHIGGYKEPYITLRKVTLPLTACVISKGHTTLLTLNVDVATWFSGIHLTAMNNVVIPSLEALKIADNYMEMFENNTKKGGQKK